MVRAWKVNHACKKPSDFKTCDETTITNSNIMAKQNLDFNTAAYLRKKTTHNQQTWANIQIMRHQNERHNMGTQYFVSPKE